MINVCCGDAWACFVFCVCFMPAERFRVLCFVFCVLCCVCVCVCVCVLCGRFVFLCVLRCLVLCLSVMFHVLCLSVMFLCIVIICFYGNIVGAMVIEHMSD